MAVPFDGRSRDAPHNPSTCRGRTDNPPSKQDRVTRLDSRCQNWKFRLDGRHSATLSAIARKPHSKALCLQKVGRQRSPIAHQHPFSDLSQKICPDPIFKNSIGVSLCPFWRGREVGVSAVQRAPRSVSHRCMAPPYHGST
jgi:hypothetical protein